MAIILEAMVSLTFIFGFLYGFIFLTIKSINKKTPFINRVEELERKVASLETKINYLNEKEIEKEFSKYK